MDHKNLVLSSLLLAAIFLSPISLIAQQTSAENRDMDAVVAEISDEKITQGDLIRYYERNNLDSDYTTEDLKEFLPFYVDYKLKLEYGEDQGLFNDPDILQEFDTYSKQAAFSYWLENEIKKEVADEFIERSRYELKSSHVLIRLDANAPDSVENAALERLKEARQLFLNGEMTMEELNQEYSSRIQGRSAGGDLPWFSAGVTVKPFEDALYSLEEGELSEPVRTQFGYHIIHLEERRERTPQRKVSHIFFRGSRDNLSAEILADSAHSALENGRPWNDVVKQFSQDGSSVDSGGDIGWVGYGTQYSEDFIETVYQLDPVASFSRPVQTNYGYHIFRIDSIRSYENEEERREELMSRLEELPRYKASREQVLQRMANEGNFTTNEDTKDRLTRFFSNADSAAVTETELPESLSSSTFATFNGQTYRASDFKDWLDETHTDRSTTEFSDLWLEMYEESILDSQVIPMTKERFPEFEREIEGFLNGLVVFEVSNENVWNIETADSSDLENYYEENINNYQYGERYDFTLLASLNDSVLSEALSMAENSVSADSLSSQFNNLIATRDSLETPAEEILTALNTTEMGGTSDKFTYRNRGAYVIFHQRLEPRAMTFDEAFHRVGSDYQPIREEKFMDELRSEYRVRIFPERIR